MNQFILYQWHNLYKKSSRWRISFIFFNFCELTPLNLWVSRNRFQSSFKTCDAASASSNVSFPDCLVFMCLYSSSDSKWIPHCWHSSSKRIRVLEGLFPQEGHLKSKYSENEIKANNATKKQMASFQYNIITARIGVKTQRITAINNRYLVRKMRYLAQNLFIVCLQFPKHF